jgi:hypothetical protein
MTVESSPEATSECIQKQEHGKEMVPVPVTETG